MIVFSPSIVASNDFVFALDDLHRSKFTICALQRITGTLERAELDFLFQEQTPRFFNVDFLEQSEFKQGTGCVMVVVEKEKAVSELSDLVGRLEIKSARDLEKYKKKQS